MDVEAVAMRLRYTHTHTHNIFFSFVCFSSARYEYHSQNIDIISKQWLRSSFRVCMHCGPPSDYVARSRLLFIYMAFDNNANVFENDFLYGNSRSLLCVFTYARWPFVRALMLELGIHAGNVHILLIASFRLSIWIFEERAWPKCEMQICFFSQYYIWTK